MGYWQYYGDVEIVHPSFFSSEERKPFNLESNYFVVDDALSYPFQNMGYRYGSWIEDLDYVTSFDFPAMTDDPWYDTFGYHKIGDGMKIYARSTKTFRLPNDYNKCFYYIVAGECNGGQEWLNWPIQGTDYTFEAHIAKVGIDGSVSWQRLYSEYGDKTPFLSVATQVDWMMQEISDDNILYTFIDAENIEVSPGNWTQKPIISQIIVPSFLSVWQLGDGVIYNKLWDAEPNTYNTWEITNYPHIRSYGLYHAPDTWDADDKLYQNYGGVVVEIGDAITLDLYYTYYGPLGGGHNHDNGLLYSNSLIEGEFQGITHIYGYQHDVQSTDENGIAISQTTILSLDGTVVLGTIEVPMEVIVPTTFFKNGLPNGDQDSYILNNILRAIGFTPDGIPDIASAGGDIYMWNGSSYDHVVDSRTIEWDKDESLYVVNNYAWISGMNSYQGWGYEDTKRIFYYNGSYYMVTNKVPVDADDDTYYYFSTIWKYTGGYGQSTFDSSMLGMNFPTDFNYGLF